MGDDGDALFRHKEAQQTQRRCARVDEDRIPIGDLLGCQTADQRLVDRVSPERMGVGTAPEGTVAVTPP